MGIHIFITDMIVGINIVLILGSMFLSLEIVRYLGIKESYVLARGWKFILPAVFILAVIHVFNFFVEYSIYNIPRLIQEVLYLFFNVLLFVGLLTQFLAIRKVIEGRG